MPKGIFLASVLLIAVATLFVSARETNAAFHLMRVYGVNAGASGDANIQYVELRMTDPSQNFVAFHHICFYDASGAPYARFNFPTNVSNGADEASILIATAEFDAAWPAGTPDFTFGAGNVTAIAGGADVSHPVRGPAGKVSFGTDGTSTPAMMCQGSFSLIDSVAYGTAYTGTVNFPPKNASDLPTAGTSALRLQGPICIPTSFSSPCPGALNNSTDYALVDVNTSGNNPRNNSGVSGPITASDADGDGVVDGSDLCPGTAPAAPVDSNGCSQAQVDADADTICDPGAVSGGPGPCTGSDNCPNWPNTGQALPNWTVPPSDPDCDGFNTARETFVGTMTTRQCALTPTAGDEPVDSWPVDLNDSRNVTLSDITTYSSTFGSIGPGLPYNQRQDFNQDNRISLPDVTFFSQYFGKSCS